MYRIPNGNLDPTLDGDGVMSTSLAVGNEGVVGLETLPDGRFLVLGAGSDGVSTKPFVARFLEDGSLDTTFGTSGIAWQSGVDLTGFATPPRMALTPAGKIMVAGVADGNANPLWVRRLHADGSVDTTFGTGGTASRLVNLYAAVSKIMIDSSGKIVVMGRSWNSGPETLTVRLTDTGAFDPTFGTGGATWFHCADYLHSIAGAAIMADGRIISTGDYGGTGRPAMVAMQLANGQLDTSFGTGGCLGIPATSFPSSLQLDSAGRAVIGSGGQVARLDPTGAGTWDPTFGTGGIVTITPSIGGMNVAVQPDDSILAFGSTYSVRSLRLHADGTRDTSYGTNGTASHPLPDVGGTFLAPASDGRIVAAYSWTNGASSDTGVVRLSSTPTSDFAAGQTWTTGGGQGVFGACLRNASLGATTGAGTWTSNGGTACTASDSDPWNGIPASTASPGALVARTTASETVGARADLQFGLRTAPTQAPGSYVAPITFDVVAP